MQQIKIHSISVYFIITLILSGCGYRLIGQEQVNREGLSIPVLGNTTTRRGLEEELTRALRQEVLNSGRIVLATDERATYQLNGTISNYELIPISFDADDLVAEYRFRIVIFFRLQNLRENRLLWEENFSTQFEYRVSPNIVETEKARITALQKASKELSQDLIPLLLERF